MIKKYVYSVTAICFCYIGQSRTSCFRRFLCRVVPENSRSFSDKNILQRTKMSAAVKKLVPLFDRILIKKFEAITKTKGGIVIPEKAADKVLQGTVVAVGQGTRLQDGSFASPAVKVGDKVLLPEYGGTKVSLEENAEYHLFRESDILAKVE